jgi:hypothetical protein
MDGGPTAAQQQQQRPRRSPASPRRPRDRRSLSPLSDSAPPFTDDPYASSDDDDDDYTHSKQERHDAPLEAWSDARSSDDGDSSGAELESAFGSTIDNSDADSTISFSTTTPTTSGGPDAPAVCNDSNGDGPAATSAKRPPVAYVFIDHEWDRRHRRMLAKAKRYADWASAQYAKLRRQLQHQQTHQSPEYKARLQQKICAEDLRGVEFAEQRAGEAARTLFWCDGCRQLYDSSPEFHQHDAERLSPCQMTSLGGRCMGSLPDSVKIGM